jgi:hypothetical protein
MLHPRLLIPLENCSRRLVMAFPCQPSFSCFFQAHVAAKYALVRILRGTKHLQSNSFIHWGTWIGVMIVVIAVGLIVAGGIPFFNGFLGLIGAFLGTSFTLSQGWPSTKWLNY